MLDTALQPYTDVADLFVIDPDGFVIRCACATCCKFRNIDKSDL